MIGLLSDTHNNERNLLQALKIYRERDIKRLYHCGDLTEPGMAKYFGGFQVVYVFGNADTSRDEIASSWKELDGGNWSGDLFIGNIGGIRIAMTHGHIDGEVSTLAVSGKFKYVFHGHTHRRRDEMISETRVINPGAVGKALGGYSICILDVTSAKAQFISLG